MKEGRKPEYSEKTPDDDLQKMVKCRHGEIQEWGNTKMVNYRHSETQR